MPSKKSSKSKRFKMNAVVKRWLAAEDLDAQDDDEDDDDGIDDWDSFIMEELCQEVIDVGGIKVDRALLSQRFSCVSHICAPGPKQGKWYSCCANAEVGLTRSEVRRLAKYRSQLKTYLLPKEPRLKPVVEQCGKKPFYLDEDGTNLCRPDERCVFSVLDAKGRIRCRLHPFTHKQGMDQNLVQPITCRVFPLQLLELTNGDAILSILTKKNYLHIGGHRPTRYPCLSDKKLPPIYESMAGDLDWIFGKGFAQALKEEAEK